MGFEEPAPRPRHRSRGIAPAWWVALVVLAVVVWLWVDNRTQTGLEPEEAPPAASEAVAYTIDPVQGEQIVHLQQMLHDAERQLAEQKLQIASLDSQLQEARADTERHKRGLEKAVDQLNRINDELLQLEAAALAQPRISFPPVPDERVGPLGAPHVTTHQFGYVVASGVVHNPTNYPARGTLEVSIVGSAGVIDTRGFLMTIRAGGTERYDVTLTNVFPTERLGAQARWVE